MKEIYLDNAATTPVDERVFLKMAPYFCKFYGNPSSLHQKGREAKSAIDNSRQTVANILKAQPEEIIFTGSGTESDNLALLGAARTYKQFGKHIIISKIEHKAVLEAAKKLEREGFEISCLDVDRDGIVDIEKFKKLLRKDTILVSIMYANNEVGTVQPLKEISNIILRHRSNASYGNLPFFHTDACQAVGAYPLDVLEIGVDLLTFNGAKIYGPKGVGCLYKKKEIQLEPQVVGGEQEWGIRAGTESVPLIVGLAKAFLLAENSRVSESKRLAGLRDYFIKKLLKEIPIAHLNGHPEKRLPNNVNISIPGIEGEAIVLMLDSYNVYASTGSACASRDLNPSHVLLAMGLSPEQAHGSVRFSLGRKTKKQDLDYVIKIMPEIVSHLQSISSLSSSFSLLAHRL